MKKEPGDLYWSVVEPYWLRLNESWDEDPSHFLEALRAVPERIQHLYAAHWCQSEVRNGGLFQFFFNSTGILAPEAVSGLNTVGATELADILAEAMRHFGDIYPRVRSERVASLPTL